MSQTQSFKFLIINIFLCFLFSLELKPDNAYEIVKIKVDNNNRTYYHLDKNDELVFSFAEKGIEDLMARFGLKTILRTLIASNSNTDKTFGIELEIIKDNTSIAVKKLTFNKKTSNAISDLKPGWNYTKAGFWFEELDDISDVSIKIRLLKRFFNCKF